jgi:hypothetical protein
MRREKANTGVASLALGLRVLTYRLRAPDRDCLANMLPPPGVPIPIGIPGIPGIPAPLGVPIGMPPAVPSADCAGCTNVAMVGGGALTASASTCSKQNRYLISSR